MAALVLLMLAVPPAEAACIISDQTCTGCGCKGGPGYRSLKTKECVGFANLASECGDPPTTCCLFENLPGAGGNRDCALETVAARLFQIEHIEALPEAEVEQLRERAFEVLSMKARESGQCRVAN